MSIKDTRDNIDQSKEGLVYENVLLSYVGGDIPVHN